MESSVEVEFQVGRMAVTELAQATQEIDAALRNLNSVLDNTMSGWEGSAKANCQNRWQSMYANGMQMTQEIEKMSENLAKVLNLLSDTDGDMAGYFSSSGDSPAGSVPATGGL